MARRPHAARRRATAVVAASLVVALGVSLTPTTGLGARESPATKRRFARTRTLEDVATNCPDRIPPRQLFKWDLPREVEVAELAQWISAVLCEPVIVPDKLKSRKIGIVVPHPVTQREAFRLLLTALRAIDITLVRGAGALLLVETADVKSHPLPVIDGTRHNP